METLYNDHIMGPLKWRQQKMAVTEYVLIK